MGAPLLKGHFQTPALHKILDDLLCRLGRIGGKERFRGTLARWITCENPTDRQGGISGAIPQRRPRRDLQRALSLTVPVQRELLPDRLRVLQYLLQGSKTGTDYSGTTHGVFGAFWRWLMKDRIQMTSRDESDLLRLRMQSQLQHGISGITHQLDFSVGKPSADQADHLVRPHPDRLVPLAQAFTHLRSRREHTQEGQGPALFGPGKGYDHCHDDPAQARATHRALAAREGAVAVMPAFADFPAPPPL